VSRGSPLRKNRIVPQVNAIPSSVQSTHTLSANQFRFGHWPAVIIAAVAIVGSITDMIRRHGWNDRCFRWGA
jgi:hypothetical protein